MATFQDIQLTLNDETGVALVRLDRPAKRNAFSQSMIDDLVTILGQIDNDGSIRAVVLTGGAEGPFCAGMDIKELSQITTAKGHARNFLKDLTDAFAGFSKPLIAAVVGFALGGGFEIALACDIIYASTTATFGLPEIKIGTIPGAGGTQRLARALGKHKAMELILTGDTISGAELERFGIVNKSFPSGQVVVEAMSLATRIAKMSGPVVKLGKRAVLMAENSHTGEGMAAEKALYYSTFSLKDFKEGQAAFLGKREPVFRHE
ncbi:enoyl-CoA hydratase/isomerase [Immersiella caudata]|uniref:Enoyl-CoA hydratase/isomerase n=1 Tax=Immersiella caudata TaxID=314043 RepID=A0AA39WYQ5_9PEZI|nr:enoyl-CoA hydratase/isomerase [Immersiella caudata]